MRTIESKASFAASGGSVVSDVLAMPAVFGRVKQAAPRVPAASNDGVFAASAIDAWARRAVAANGFGAADLSGAPPAAARVEAGEALAQFVDAPHRASFAQIARAFADLAADALRGAVAKWRAGRIARAARAELAQLDDRTLSDLGLHRSELGSIAAELAREADTNRRRVLLSLHTLPI
ncbi:MAG: hypothetical protein AMXMBFR72_18600 [Betaproteobacteria bacterium]